MLTYYEVLGIKRAATPEEIKAAYRQKARDHHPDFVQDDRAKQQAGARFRVVKEAFEVLSNPRRRAAYDRNLAPDAPPGAAEEPPGAGAATGSKAGWCKEKAAQARASFSWAKGRVTTASERVKAVVREEGQELARDLGREAVDRGISALFDGIFGPGKSGTGK